MDYREMYDAWCNSPAVDADTRAELMAIVNESRSASTASWRSAQRGYGASSARARTA